MPIRQSSSKVRAPTAANMGIIRAWFIIAINLISLMPAMSDFASASVMFMSESYLVMSALISIIASFKSVKGSIFTNSSVVVSSAVEKGFKASVACSFVAPALLS